MPKENVREYIAAQMRLFTQRGAAEASQKARDAYEDYVSNPFDRIYIIYQQARVEAYYQIANGVLDDTTSDPDVDTRVAAYKAWPIGEKGSEVGSSQVADNH
jgi:hypothetical protein